MALTIGQEARDAIRNEILTELSASGDIWITLRAGDYEAARRLRDRLVDEMRLLDDLGWEPDLAQEQFELTVPPANLARVLMRLTENAQAVLSEHVAEPIAELDLVRRALVAQSAYTRLLASLAAPGPCGSAA